MNSELVMFILQGCLGVIMLFLGIIMNGMRTALDRVNQDLKGLNNAVLGEYVTRKDSDGIWAVHRTETDTKWAAQRILDHEMRSLITTAMIDIAKVSGKPYNYGGDEVK